MKKIFAILCMVVSGGCFAASATATDGFAAIGWAVNSPSVAHAEKKALSECRERSPEPARCKVFQKTEQSGWFVVFAAFDGIKVGAAGSNLQILIEDTARECQAKFSNCRHIFHQYDNGGLPVGESIRF